MSVYKEAGGRKQLFKGVLDWNHRQIFHPARRGTEFWSEELGSTIQSCVILDRSLYVCKSQFISFYDKNSQQTSYRRNLPLHNKDHILKTHSKCDTQW